MISGPQSIRCRLRRAHVAGALLALAALALLAPAAQAAPESTPTWAAKPFFGTTGSEPGQFSEPGQIASEPDSGNLLVADTANGRVQVFATDSDANVSYLTNLGAGTIVTPVGIAVDPDDGSIYVSDAGAGEVFRFTSDGAATPTYTLDAGFTSPALASYASQLAVDPTTQDLLVADASSQEVRRFDVADGSQISAFNGSSSGAQFSSMRSLAVSSSGVIYVVDEPYLDAVSFESTGGRVESFDSAGASLGQLTGIDLPGAVTTDPEGGSAIVSWQNSYIFSPRRLAFYEDSNTPGQLVDYPASVQASVVSLTMDADGEDQIFALLRPLLGVAGIQAFKPADIPDAEIGPTSDIDATSAHVSGSVAPGVLSGPGTVRFEYSRDGSTWTSTPDQEGIVGPGAVSVSADLTGLRPSTTYEVRLHIVNEDFSATSSSASFTTDKVEPEATLGPVTDRTATSAVLNGKINPFGDQTTYHFEYGETPAYGKRAPAGEDVAGNGFALRLVHHAVEGLQPATTYHYRLVATNSVGTIATEDATFTTRAATEAARAYEQVTPVDKGGAVLNTYAYWFAREDGNALVYQTKNAMDLPGVEGSPLQSRYASRRTSEGWDLRPLDPPQNPVVAPFILGAATYAISPDFSHALVGSNRALTPGAVEGSGNLYRRDIETGALEFVATGLHYGILSGPSGANVFYAGSTDFSRIVIQSESKLTSDDNEGRISMYEWTPNGGLQLIPRKPDGTPTDGSAGLFSRLSYPTRNFITADGSDVYFSIQGGSAEGIYRTREGVTTRIFDSGEPVSVVDVAADGRYLLYRSAITGDLYRYDTQGEASTLVFTGINAGGGIGYMGMSANGESVFRFGDGNVTPMVWHDGVTTEITPFVGYPGIAIWGVYASSNGRYFVFSTPALEGQSYDNSGCVFNPVDGDTGGRCYEVYLYDVVQQELTCVSCPADGSRSTGHAHLGPGGVELNFEGGRYVNDDGEVFFSTPTKLVAADTNGSRDVYMFQGGDLQLISPGQGNYSATLADVSADGDDVFFITDQQLVGQDRDDQLDMYDARVGGGIPSQNPSPPSPPCAEGRCAEAAAPQSAPTPGSMSLAGPRDRAPSSKVSIRGPRTFRGAAGTIRVEVPGPGTLSLTGAGLKPLSKRFSQGGTYKLGVSLNSRGRELLRTRERLRVKAKVTFEPAGGEPASIAPNLTFDAATTKKAGGR